MKKLLSLVVLIVGIFLLSGCELKKDTSIDLDNETPPIEIEPLMVGFYIQIQDKKDYTNLLPVYGNEEAVFYYSHRVDNTFNTASGYGLNKRHVSVRSLEDTINGVKTHIDETEIEVTILVSNELDGSYMNVYPIYEGDYSLGETFNGTMIQGGISSTLTYKNEVKIDNKIVRKQFKITVNVQNTLEQVEIIEMSSVEEVLKRTVITEPINTYDTLALTSYVIIKETFRDSQGSTYVKTSIYDKYNRNAQLNFLGKFGLIKTEYLNINFI